MPKLRTRKRIRRPTNLEYFKAQDSKLFSAQIVLKKLDAVAETLGAHGELTEKTIDITSKGDIDTVNDGAVEVIAHLAPSYCLPVCLSNFIIYRQRK